MRNREKIRREISRKGRRVNLNESEIRYSEEYNNEEPLKNFLERSYNKKVHGRNKSDSNSVQDNYYNTSNQKECMKFKENIIMDYNAESTIKSVKLASGGNEKSNKENHKLNMVIMRCKNCIRLLSENLPTRNQPLKSKN